MARKISLSIALVFSLVVFALPAQALIVYSDSFDSPATLGGGATAVFTPSGGGLQSSIAPYDATYGSFFRNNSTGMTELTLSNLPSHTGVDVSFVLAFLDSWDSRDGPDGCCTPDNVDLYIDGVQVASYTYTSGAGGTINDIGGGTLIAEYVQFDTNPFYVDTIADMSGDPGLAFAHSGNTLIVGFQASGAGWQGDIAPLDEAWGIDNLQVEVIGTPEPSSAALMLGGLAGLVAVARRRPRRSRSSA